MEAIETNLITGLPEGYTSRPTVPEDAELVAKILEAEARTIGQTRKFNGDEIRDDWKSPNFVLADSSQSVVTSDGTVIGFVTVWDTDKTPVHPHVSFAIHPDHTSKSLGLAMLAWGEERAKQVIDRCPPGSRISMRSGTNDKHETRKAILEAYDMKQIRYFFRMLINMDEAPPKPQLPEGYSIRTATMPDELEAIVQAERDGFKDHWGYVEQPFEEELKEWKHWLETDKLFDPTVWFLAIDDATGDIAGMSLCRTEQWSDPSVAYVDALAVLRGHRKKGIALALLHHTFGVFWERGRKDIALHVDATSLTGAVRLYERAGMHEDERSASYEKLLRDGEELMTTSAE